MSITKETQVTLRKTLVNEQGYKTNLTRTIVGAADEVTINGSAVGDMTLETKDLPALIAGLQELLGAA